jgi:acyl-CoA thioesterase-2
MRERYGPAVTPTMDLTGWPVETRYVDRVPWADGAAAPANRLWMRSLAPLPDDYLTQCAALLYAGDLHMFEPVLFPGQVSWHRLVNRAGYFGATLDYAMWFHRPFRFDQWMLHEQEAPAIASSRGLTTGRFWTADGTLAASVSELVAIFPDHHT